MKDLKEKLNNLHSKKFVYLTSDIEWATEEQISFFRSYIVSNNLKCTIFITHYSNETKKMIEDPAHFEIGIHPNFMKGSSHGTSLKQVIDFFEPVLEIAKGARSHGLLNHTSYYNYLCENTNLSYEISTYMPRLEIIQPCKFEYREKVIYKIPFNWEDDMEFTVMEPIWNIKKLASKITGENLILNFHPIHLFYNNSSQEKYLISKNIDNKLKPLKKELLKNQKGAFTMLKSIAESNYNCKFVSELLKK